MPSETPTRWPVWFIPAVLVTLLADLLSKSLIFAIPREQLPRWLEHHYNTGVAWSLLADWPGLVTLLTIVLIPLLAWLWWREYRQQGPLANLAFGLILGGALGNGYDRILARFGHWPGVRDFIHLDLGFWPLDPFPTFNVADSAITIGFACLLILAWRPRPALPTAPSTTANDDPHAAQSGRP